MNLFLDRIKVFNCNLKRSNINKKRNKLKIPRYMFNSVAFHLYVIK